MTCHVYMIKAGEYCKIGITGDLMARLRTIQTSNPVEVSLLASQRYDNTQDALAVEKAIHDNFGFKYGRVKGEWFNYCEPYAFDDFSSYACGRYSVDAMRSYRDAQEEIINHKGYSDKARSDLLKIYSGLEAEELFAGDKKRTPIIDNTDRRYILDFLNSMEL